MAGLTIGKFAAAGSVGVETVRFCQRRGLLARPQPRGSGYRGYTAADQRRLAFIRRARRLGFALGQIADLLGPAEARPLRRSWWPPRPSLPRSRSAQLREFADVLDAPART